MIKIDEKINEIKKLFSKSPDLSIRRVDAGDKSVALVYIDAMINADQMEIGVIQPLIKSEGKFQPTLKGMLSVLTAGVIVEICETLTDATGEIAAGECLLIGEGFDSLIILKLRGYLTRPATEPPTSAVIKGPREGFTEDMKTNMVLLRRRFRSENLCFEHYKVGRYTQTNITLAYLKGIADENLVEKVGKKIDAIDIDGIVDSSYISQFLEDRNYSIFKQVGTAEKPDIIAAKILEGRVAIIVDGSPIVLTLPFMLLEDFQDSQDYYKRSSRATFLRVLRLMAVFFAVFLPGMFVALQMHQFQVLPLKLLITIINSISGIPFSPIVEMIIALLLFEILGEASVRMPRYVGMATSVVGAIILGETAVNAGLLSSLTVLITALSSIGMYAIPDEVGTFGLIRFLFVFVAGASGMFGMVIASIILIAYVVTMEVYGTPYAAPFAPLITEDLKDGLVRLKIGAMDTRPASLNNKNKKRLGGNG